MSIALHRRMTTLERRLPPDKVAPAFLLAASAAEAERELAVIGAEHPDHRGTLFVMIGPSTPQTEET